MRVFFLIFLGIATAGFADYIPDVYRNCLKNRNYTKDTFQNFDLERATIAIRQEESEKQNCGVKPTPAEVDPSAGPSKELSNELLNNLSDDLSDNSVTKTNIKLFSGSANQELAKEIARHLGIEISSAAIGRFNDGEIRIRILEEVRNCDVFISQSLCVNEESTINDNLMELYLMIRAMKRGSAKSVTAVIPYYAYSRQDRKKKDIVPISASDVAMLLELAGADRVISVDLHCGQIQGFFHKAPVDNLYSSSIFVPYIANLGLLDPVIVSPDAGGVERAKNFIDGLQAAGIPTRMAIMIKQRDDAGIIESMHLVGKVRDCDVVIVDDICDTAGTLVQAAKELRELGARRVFACITHPLLSGPACSRIEQSCLEEVVFTDTIPLCKNCPSNIKQLSIAPILAKAILSEDYTARD